MTLQEDLEKAEERFAHYRDEAISLQALLGSRKKNAPDRESLKQRLDEVLELQRQAKAWVKDLRRAVNSGNSGIVHTQVGQPYGLNPNPLRQASEAASKALRRPRTTLASTKAGNGAGFAPPHSEYVSPRAQNISPEAFTGDHPMVRQSVTLEESEEEPEGIAGEEFGDVDEDAILRSVYEVAAEILDALEKKTPSSKRTVLIRRRQEERFEDFVNWFEYHYEG